MSALGRIVAAGQAPARRLVVSRDAGVHEQVADAARALGWANPEAVSGELSRAGAVVGLGQPPALIVADLDGESDPLAALEDLAVHCPPETRVVALGTANDVALFRALLETGVADYLVKPLDHAQLEAALARAAAEAGRPETPAPAETRDGKLMAVIGARGGCGATSVAASLSWALANRLAQRTILFDLDLHFGSVAFDFGIEPGAALAELLATPDRLDERLVAGVMTRARDELHIVSATLPLEQDLRVRPEAVAALVTTLRAAADWVVADVPRHLDATSRLALRVADVVLLVAPPTLDGLRDAQRLSAYATALRAGAPPLLVVNGASKGDAIAARQFEQVTGRPPLAVLPVLAGQGAAAQAHALPIGALADGRGGNPFVSLAAAAAGLTPTPPRKWRLPWRRA
jgi:pilus assembly protein CpaE